MRRITLLFISIFILPIGLFSQVVADFSTVDKVAGCPPLFVHFTNASSGSGVLSYKWSIGNGVVVTQVNPSRTYIVPGKYDIKLVVTNGVESDSITKTEFLEVFNPPTTLFTPLDTLISCAPNDVQFTNLSLVGSSPIAMVRWDFGDGYVSSVPNPKHPYVVPGIYTPSLTLRDSNGCTSSLSINNQIKVYKPNALFSSGDHASCEGALTVPFTNLSEGNGTMRYLWDFGDGTFSTVKDSLHYFEGVGNYTVSLKVMDDKGCSDTITKVNYVVITSIIASFSMPTDTVCPGSAVQFTNTTLNSTTYSWDFGDGAKSTLQNPKHTYAKAGSYEVVLQATNGLCGGIAKKTIVAEFLKAEFVPASRYGCQVPDTVSYLNTSVNAASYDWRFGNNTTSIAKLPTVVFEFDNLLNKNRQRSYSDTLIITSARGCKSRMILDSSVVIILPRANFTPNPFDGIGTMQGCAPLTVNFKDKSVYNSKVDNIASYKWDFMGESKPSRTIKEFTEVFNKDTITQVRLTVTTQKGCVAATTYDFGSGHKQTPDFDISNSSHTLCASERVNFINKTTDMDKVNSITWIWGDGESGSIDDSHLYTKIGPMSVTLEVSSYGCKEKIFKEDFVTILGPIATFSYSTDCKKPYEKSFTSKIIDATNFSWNLGDGTVVTDVAAFKHTYLAKGDYSVSLNAINGSCTSSPEPSTIMVRDLEVKASLVAPLSCVSSPYLFNSSKTMGATKWINGTVAATYLYDFGDGSKPIFTNDTVVTHRFAKRGNYKVTLVAKDENQCADTLISYQRIYRPYSDFAPVYLTGCMPIDFSFTNNSKADTLSSILSSKWIFGDGNSSTLTNPSHQYIKWGNYNVSLISTDNKGCSDTIVKVGAVNATYPNPKFVALDTTLCVGDTAYFSSIVPTTIASYLWTYPDGSTSVAPKGKYKFSADGKFDVKLYVVDKHGCDTLGTQLNFIKVQKPPVVDFTASPLVSNCYPTEITFTDQSVSAYLGGWRWNFGDAKGFSYRQNPQHIYIRPGKFDVKLVATTTYGCSDSLTKIKYVNPKGPFAKVIARDTICRDASMSLEMAEPFNVYSFKWDLGDGSVQLDTTINHSYRDVGYFYPGLFLVSDTTHSCDKFIRDTVYVSETLARYKLNNSSSKGCVPYQISYSNLSTHANQWKWEFGEGSSTNEFEPDITYPTDGLYSGKLSVRNELGCTDSVLLKPITVFPLPVVTISRDTFICLNSSTLLEATGGVVYKWTPELGLSDVASSTPYASPNNNTHYTVLVTDINSCQRQESVMITVQQYPVAQAPDSSIIVGESVHLNVNALDIKSYYWSPNYNISCTDCADPVVQPLQDTIYTVTVQDTANCFIKSYSTKISVERKYSVDLPTAFTPNGDGVNDEVFVKGWGIKELITFRVFNRFGQMIFETNDINKGWNGEGNGVAQMGDTYQFIVKILTYNDAVITKTGTIKIIK